MQVSNFFHCVLFLADPEIWNQSLDIENIDPLEESDMNKNHNRSRTFYANHKRSQTLVKHHKNNSHFHVKKANNIIYSTKPGVSHQPSANTSGTVIVFV